ncbi:helix-turn-helix domain-containing protein [Streptomyces sp. P38-E01]|uniref:Helix-turn-helix domain-containing protein n=1 Tax=Streptomyces tardus TaxID=2780544 RepID=A0A949JE71_9ACTN|nr:helix-turn-helix domain-containing protein [Streptomyces tardus]MBU7598412.1 helix-turn-helix domain-containing protein [Streptomyces tardus]
MTSSGDTPEAATSADLFRNDGRHRVAVLVRDGVMPMELGLVHQLFRQARTATRGTPLYEVVTCTLEPGEVRTDADFPILVSAGPRTLAEADTVILPATHLPDATETEGRLPAALASALAQVRPGTRLASICTGAYVLAAAGLLDGRRATTHWHETERFRSLFPSVRLDPEVLYVDEGDVLTSAGEASGIDLCLHMIRCDHGAGVAAEVARRTVVPPHREGGQAQFIRRPVAEPSGTSTGRARAWALAHLGEPITLGALAAQESMSVRTFNRRFREETGQTPMQWLNGQRVERARELLESTEYTVDRVAAESGLGTATTLRQRLQATVGVSPRTYRVAYRGAAHAPDER